MNGSPAADSGAPWPPAGIAWPAMAVRACPRAGQDKESGGEGSREGLGHPRLCSAPPPRPQTCTPAVRATQGTPPADLPSHSSFVGLARGGRAPDDGPLSPALRSSHGHQPASWPAAVCTHSAWSAQTRRLRGPGRRRSLGHPVATGAGSPVAAVPRCRVTLGGRHQTSAGADEPAGARMIPCSSPWLHSNRSRTAGPVEGAGGGGSVAARPFSCLPWARLWKQQPRRAGDAPCQSRAPPPATFAACLSAAAGRITRVRAGPLPPPPPPSFGSSDGHTTPPRPHPTVSPSPRRLPVSAAGGAAV